MDGTNAMAMSTRAATKIAPTTAQAPSAARTRDQPRARSEMTSGAAAAAMTADSTSEAVSATRTSEIHVRTTASPPMTRRRQPKASRLVEPRRNEPRSAIRRGRRVSRRHRTSSVPDAQRVYRSPTTTTIWLGDRVWPANPRSARARPPARRSGVRRDPARAGWLSRNRAAPRSALRACLGRRAASGPTVAHLLRVRLLRRAGPVRARQPKEAAVPGRAGREEGPDDRRQDERRERDLLGLAPGSAAPRSRRSSSGYARTSTE